MTTIQTIHQYRCDLSKGPSEVNLKTPIMHQDSLGDVFRVSVWNGSKVVDLTGVTAQGFLYLAATHQTILLNGIIDGSAACITLKEECYSIPGYASLVIQLHQGNVRHTVLKVNFAISRTGTEHIFDPEHMLPSAAELIAMIDTIRDASDFANAKLDANLGAHHSGELLYVSADGSVQPLTLGPGLQIVNGTLCITDAVLPDDDEPMAVLLTVDEYGYATLSGTTLSVNENGAALLDALVTIGTDGQALII